jgi:hypothetical protein
VLLQTGGVAVRVAVLGFRGGELDAANNTPHSSSLVAVCNFLHTTH